MKGNVPGIPMLGNPCACDFCEIPKENTHAPLSSADEAHNPVEDTRATLTCRYFATRRL